MPAPKPQDLNVRHDTLDDRDARDAGESAFVPSTELTVRVPVSLYGHEYAKKVWRRLIEIYQDLDAKIVSKLDEDMLVDYCLVMEELIGLDRLRDLSMVVLEKLRARADEIADPDSLYKIIKETNTLLREIKSVDARSDRKRTLLHKLRQSLYLTPRSRAGVNPEAKAPEDDDPMSELLDM